MAKIIDQTARDKNRSAYRVAFPSDLDPERVTAWLRSITGTLRPGAHLINGVPSIVLEVWASNKGIVHRLRVPWQYEPYIRPRLESLIPGVRLVPEDEYPVRQWVHAVEAGLRASHRQLRIYSPSDLSTTILTNFGALQDDETLMMQWVVSPAVPQHKPVFKKTTTKEMSLKTLMLGDHEASKDEVNDRRDKLDEPNMMAVLRVGAVAATPIRAQFMVRGVMAALDSSRGPATRFYRRLVTKKGLQAHIDLATSPMQWPVQLSAPELTAVVGWPLGNPMVAGLPAAVSRYLPAAESVPREGRVIGMSTFPGRERKIAISYEEARKHVHVLGGTGAGKTTLLANMIRQDMENGYGVVLIESKGDLFKQALDYVPPDRINDVVVFDVNDTQFPVGFNILQQGDPAKVVDELNMVFNALFRDHPSLWMQEVMYYGLRTLVEDKNATFVDLAALVQPAPEDDDWRQNLIGRIRDPQLASFWKRFESQGRQRQDQKAEPLMSRIWPMTRSKLMNIVGQAQSSFYMDDVVKQNKILLVNLSGIERGAATLMGTLLMNNLWNSIKEHHSEKGMFLYLDEFHHYMNLPIDIEQMLVESRSMGLGMVLAHQYLDQLTAPNMEQAIMSNARTKISFQLGASDARTMSNNFGNNISAEDLLNLAKFEAVSRVSTGEGVSAPLTLSTLPPSKPHGKADQVRYVSRQQYGRPVAKVQDELVDRHKVESSGKARKPRPFAEGWGSGS